MSYFLWSVPRAVSVFLKSHQAWSPDTTTLEWWKNSTMVIIGMPCPFKITSYMKTFHGLENRNGVEEEGIEDLLISYIKPKDTVIISPASQVWKWKLTLKRDYRSTCISGSWLWEEVRKVSLLRINKHNPTHYQILGLKSCKVKM